MIFIYTILVISLLFNLIILFFDFIPFFFPKFKRRLIVNKQKNRGCDVLSPLLIDTSLNVILRNKSLMIWNDHRSIAERCFDLVTSKGAKSFKKYNYPNAFLMYGLVKSIYNEEVQINSFRKNFDTLIDINGNFTFDLNKVDQVTYGLVCLEFYKLEKEDKYIKAADLVYKFIRDNYFRNNGIVLYRDNHIVWLNDMIGLVIPFLIKYYDYTKNDESIKIAKNQLQYYIEFGVDRDTFIPAHGIDLQSKIKIGSSNWGRGIGWYFLGLKELFELDGSFEKEYYGLSNTLMKLKNKEGLWSQFPGSSDTFDSSTTLMFLYCLPKEMHTIDDILSLMDKYISKDGYVLQCSGDTYDLNSYSKTFGKSELSQGMMLLLLERYK